MYTLLSIKSMVFFIYTILFFLKPANEFLDVSHIDEVICIKFSIIWTDFTNKFIKIVTSIIF